MKILYVSNACSREKFEEFLANCEEKPEQASQKFNLLTMLGLAKNGERIISLTTLPVNRKRSKKYFFKMEQETRDTIEYLYLPIINIPIIKVIMNLILVSIFLLKICLSVKEEKVIICDALNFSSSIAAQIISHIFKVEILGIVTDIPRMMDY
ncbi:MAG: hypothetical protein KIG60_08100 [Caryophanon sp.]|nr:hypothetical protein [Caryophanon sp.]